MFNQSRDFGSRRALFTANQPSLSNANGLSQQLKFRGNITVERVQRHCLAEAAIRPTDAVINNQGCFVAVYFILDFGKFMNLSKSLRLSNSPSVVG